MSERTFDDVTVVLQGPLGSGRPGSPKIETVVESITTHLPGAAIVLATWDLLERPSLPVTDVLWLEDPGPLPPLKTKPPAPNNANRQIVSTRAGLAHVRTKYALKMRTDCLLTGHAFTRLARAFPERDAAFEIFEERIVVSSLYSIDPRVIERIPFHLSDWFQFGLTTDLRKLWNAPLVTLEDATYFARTPHSKRSRPLERRFLARFAVEQHIFLICVRRTHEVGCSFVDDVRAEDLALQDRLLANNVVLAAPDRLGFVFPKNAWASRSIVHRFNCYSHLDWLNLYARFASAHAPRPFARLGRRLMKRLVRLIAPALQSFLSRR